VKLEIELNIAADAAVTADSRNTCARKPSCLFAGRKIPAGKAAQELGLTRIAFMDLLRQRGIRTPTTRRKIGVGRPAIVEFERRGKIA